MTSLLSELSLWWKERNVEAYCTKDGIKQGWDFPLKFIWRQNLLPEIGCIFSGMHGLLYQHWGNHRERFLILICKRKCLDASKFDDLLWFADHFMRISANQKWRARSWLCLWPAPLCAQPNACWRHNINTSVWKQKRTAKKNSKSEEVWACCSLQILTQTALLRAFLPLGENTVSSEANTESFKQSLLHEFPSSMTSSTIILAYYCWRVCSEEKKERKGELPALNLESWLYPFIPFTLWNLFPHRKETHCG